MRRFTTIVLILALLAVGSAASAAEPAASVATIKGDCRVVRGGESRTAAGGMRLFVGDVLVTGPDSAMGVVFNDDTIMSMGPDSEIEIDEFVFKPAEGEFGFLTNMVSGTAQFITGEIAKFNPDAMSVETPMATIGIRGTRFLVKVTEE